MRDTGGGWCLDTGGGECFTHVQHRLSPGLRWQRVAVCDPVHVEGKCKVTPLRDTRTKSQVPSVWGSVQGLSTWTDAHAPIGPASQQSRSSASDSCLPSSMRPDHHDTSVPVQGIEEAATRAEETALRVQEVQGAVADLERLKADKAATATVAQLQMRVQDIMEEVTTAVQARSHPLP